MVCAAAAAEVMMLIACVRAGFEDWELIRVWKSTSFKKRATEEREQELSAAVELDESQTKDMMWRGFILKSLSHTLDELMLVQQLANPKP